MIQSAAAQANDSLGPKLFQAVAALSDRILSYAIALAAIGALSMALIEAWKKINDTRTKFHARRWTSFMFPRPTKEDGTHTTSLASETRELAYRQLLQLGSGATEVEAMKVVTQLVENGQPPLLHAFRHSAGYALFAQETTVMMSLIQDAVDTSMAAVPDAYKELFDVMTEGANASDVEQWLERNAVVVTDPVAARELANAYGRLRQIARRKLDGFQVYTVERWASGNQLYANVVGMLIMVATMWTLTEDDPAFTGTWGTFKILLLSLGGGLLAPVAKDLVSALKKVREP
jgi:hypothetical protein